MPRFTLFSKHVEPSAEDVATIEGNPDVVVLDRTGQRAFLIEAQEDTALRLRRALRNWLVEPERVHPRPDAR